VTSMTSHDFSGSAVGSPLLEVRNLVVTFRQGGLFRRGGDVQAVNDVSLQIARGETLGVVGESGSGKSTLARTIVQLEQPSSGSIRFAGEDVAAERQSSAASRRKIQMIFQDSLNSLNPRRSIESTVAEPLVVHNLVPAAKRRERVAELLEQVGLQPELMRRRPLQLSGGQRQRVNIARALACEPELIIADEPTSSLDVTIRAQILALMRELQRERHLSYLFISHDLHVVRSMSDRVAVMYLGHVIETASRRDLYREPKHPYTQALLAAAPTVDPELERRRRGRHIPGEIPSPANPPSGCVFHPRCPLRIGRCDSEVPLLRTLDTGHQAACHVAE